MSTTDEATPMRYDTSRDMKTIKTRQGNVAYLGVKGRVTWLRAEHPDAQIVTEKVDGGIEAGWVEFKCTITIGSRDVTDGDKRFIVAGATATGHASETHQDFPDFYEKAETKAIGRACAALGYGTEGARDFDDGEPLDGAAASKEERANRRMDPQERQQVDAMHERVNPQGTPRHPQPAPSTLPATRTHPQQPDGQDRARANIAEKMAARGLPVLPMDTYAEIAETVNRALHNAGSGVEVKTDAHGAVTPGAILNALMALPSAVPTVA